MTDISIPDVGTRLSHSGYIGTVRFVGQVDGTQGTWIGVEWDDPQRGKHDGVKDGKRYFNCLVPHSGSFIRPSKSISYGTSFLAALTARYVEGLHEVSTNETVILGSSNGTIEVEAPGLNKIRAKLSRLDTLRQVSLDEYDVATANSPGEISQTCPSIRGLDLSKSLIPSWEVVALITTELTHLESLALNQNRLILPSRSSPLSDAFKNLNELRLNATRTTWYEFRVVARWMPHLRTVELGYNNLESLSIPSTSENHDLQDNTTVETLNLDTNRLSGWTAVCEALRPFTALQRLVLSSNGLETVDTINDVSSSPIQSLKHLALSFNALKTWADIDRIARWCPELESLKFIGNPLVEDPILGKNARQFTIARLSSLVTLDAAAISSRERTDSELLYLSYVSTNGPVDEAAKCLEHPRWKELCEKHGTPDVAKPDSQGKQDTLGNRLFDIHINTCTRVPSPTDNALTLGIAIHNNDSNGGKSSGTPPTAMRVLPTMTMRTFRLKLCKTLKIPKPKQASVKLWLVMPDNRISEIDNEQSTHDLSWWGIENGSSVLVYVG